MGLPEHVGGTTTPAKCGYSQPHPHLPPACEPHTVRRPFLLNEHNKENLTLRKPFNDSYHAYCLCTE
ncbi:hypothetical protein BD414DRAFT_487156 [Trametes punicea]|nr:hypothetical protein BD414DRAFT_487156 [Trametes punicea]